MDGKLIDVEEVKSVLKKVGFKQEECEQCMGWRSPKLDEPLASDDTVLAKLTPEEQGFLRCVGYAHEEKEVVDSLRLMALQETFWTAVRTLHDLPLCDLTVKEGKYIVMM